MRATGTSNRKNHGLSALEVFVALTLLSCGLTFSATLLVRHGRLMMEQRQYRLALDELSNQLERLAALSGSERAAALKDLRPSDFAAERLPEARLAGELQAAEWGQRLTLWIIWEGRRESAAPLALSTWIDAGEGEMP